MFFVGIDISKYKHDFCVLFNQDVLIVDSFLNNQKGFQYFLEKLKSYDKSLIRIGLEATGHYGMNLKLFLENNDYSFMEFNPLLISQFLHSTTLRRCKTDKADSSTIARYLSSTEYKPIQSRFYHNYSLKSLSRLRESLVKKRSFFLVQITNLLDITFPEFKYFFDNKLSKTALFILEKYLNADKISKMKDYESLRRISNGRFSYAKFANLKELAKNTVGESTSEFDFQLSLLINLLKSLYDSISLVDQKISTIFKDLNPPLLSIPGIGVISAAAILSEFGDISKFSSPAKMLSFAGLEPSIIQSGIKDGSGKMVKHGSGHLRYHLMLIANIVIRYNPTFYDYYLKKRSEGKSHRVALSHVCKKLIRVIYKLEKYNISFDSSLLK